MVKPWTIERLDEYTHKQLNTLYENALRLGTQEAEDILALLMQSGKLDRLGGGFPRTSPVIQKIIEVCRSKNGISAMVEAANRGEAPMAGIDPILQIEVGSEYGQRDSTAWAGVFVKEEMEAEGWRHEGRKSLPNTCKAKTAAFFVKENA